MFASIIRLVALFALAIVAFIIIGAVLSILVKVAVIAVFLAAAYYLVRKATGRFR